MALLMPVEQREQWTVLARGLSSYFNSPGRLAAVRRRFERASRRQGVDPATFAMELGILAVRGFVNMGERACGLMVRNKFIVAQQSQALRRHLDGVSVEASIGDIMDGCRVWESHAEIGCDGQDRKFPHTISQVAEGTQPQLGSMTSDALHESTGRVLPMPALSHPGVTCSSSDCELLIKRLMEVVQPGGREYRSDHKGRILDLEYGVRFASMRFRGWMHLLWCLVWKGDGSFITSTVGTRLGGGSPGAGVESSVFLLWSTGTWGEPMLTDGHLFSLYVGWLVGWCQKWPLPSGTDEPGWTELYSGNRGMVRAGGSASRIIGDRGATDPGAGMWTRGTPVGLATTVGGCPWIFRDLRCPGLSGTGEPLFYDGWTV